jgi:polygalacturonase
MILSRIAACLALAICMAKPGMAAEFDVRAYGAKGDGAALDSPAINRAILAAEKVGGGTVVLPPGKYLSFSIRLRSHITLRIEKGATLLAATPSPALGHYDPPEPNEWGDEFQYQDFGHSHWHNSLVWGEGLENVAIVGQGLIDGTALLRNASYINERAAGPNNTLSGDAASKARRPATDPVGQGNKALAFKNSKDVRIEGVTILKGGHFAVLATGVDGLEIRNVTIDTNRDGLDIDASQQVRIRDCRINAPSDDAIVLKSSYALGAVRDTTHVSIERCVVSGYDTGTLLDGTRMRTMQKAPDGDGPTARIKIGTETNGSFRHISIRDCRFERSRGLAFESVDGGTIEDVTVSHLQMHEVANAPIFLRLGNRARGPAGTRVGAIRRIRISDLTADAADSRYGAVLIAGLPGHFIEDVQLENIRVVARGGLTPEIVARQPESLINGFFLRGPEAGVFGPRAPLDVPLRDKAYPEPSMFGLLPASGIYARFARDLRVRNVRISFQQPDSRPKVVLQHVEGVRLESVVIEGDAPALVQQEVSGLTIEPRKHGPSP